MEEKIKLTKREYLGEGQIYHFLNLNTGKEEVEPIPTKEAYEALGTKKGWILNPTKPGKRFIGASYGQPKLDTPDTVGKTGDCFQKEDGSWGVYEDKEILGKVHSDCLVSYSDEEFNKKYTWQ